jgi:prepilin-type N-terminal cleavage/methylation domain-containing protein
MIKRLLEKIKLKRGFWSFFKGANRGFSMVEVLAAVAILATIGVALLAGLNLSTRVMMKIDSNQSAKDMAVAQMEYVKNLPFSATYAPDSSLTPAGSRYSVEIITSPLKPDNSLQKVTIRVLKGGQTVVQLDDYRTQ